MTRAIQCAAAALVVAALLACSPSDDARLPASDDAAAGAGGHAGTASAGAGGTAGNVSAGSAGTDAAGSGGTAGVGSAGSNHSDGGGAAGSGGAAGGAGTEMAGSNAGAAGSDRLRDSGSPASDAAADSGTGQLAEGGEAGADADAARVVLFDGTSLDDWQALNGGGRAPWRIVAANQAMEVVPNAGDIISKKKFEDVFLHIEYMTPKLGPQTDPQARGNSGIYLRMSYEMQVLETHDLTAMIDGCGAVYEVKAPLVVACFDQLIWNTYEIEFKAPKYDARGTKTANARFTKVTLNGKVVQIDTEVPGMTRSGQPEAPGPQPIKLQDHQHTVQFRNIWAIPRN